MNYSTNGPRGQRTVPAGIQGECRTYALIRHQTKVQIVVIDGAWHIYVVLVIQNLV